MNQRELQQLKEQRAKTDFAALERRLFVLHAQLLSNRIKAFYVPHAASFAMVVQAVADRKKQQKLAATILREAERVAGEMCKHFPRNKRWIWEQRFVAFAVHGDYRSIPEIDQHIIVSFLPPAERAACHRLLQKHGRIDATASRLTETFIDSFNNEDNALAHLYEVWETLSEAMGGEKETLDAIGLSKKRRRRLTRLANDAPLRQGRHRGKHSEEDLQDATEEELRAAREIAATMICGYLHHLDQTKSGT